MYSPITKTGLITLPKEVRNYLQLDKDGGLIAVENVGRHKIQICSPSISQLSFSRKVTRTGQFKLPAPIKKNWSLKQGSEVLLISQDPYIIISLEGIAQSCPPCLASGFIHARMCPICNGSGSIRKSPSGANIDLSEYIIKLQGYSLIDKYADYNDLSVLESGQRTEFTKPIEDFLKSIRKEMSSVVFHPGN